MPFATVELPGLADLPVSPSDPDVLRRIRAHNAETDAWFVVLDDDPTGSQAVFDVTVVVKPTVEDLVSDARERRPVFIWTNSRSLPEPDAIEISRAHVRSAIDAARQAGARPIFVSRSDSTLRGHFAAEIAAITDACRDAGEDVDGVVFAPAFLEAGRVTADDVQWVRQADGHVVPAAHTEFARDATFGYRETNLREWVAARTALPAAKVTSISLDAVRGDTTETAQLVGSLADGAIAIGNAVAPGDLEALADACQTAERAGRRLMYRCGPSFVRALMGQPSRAPLTAAELSDIALDTAAAPSGLTVVGSHTALTTAQLAQAQRQHRLTVVELDVDRVLADSTRAAGIADAIAELSGALRHTHAALVTSRSVRTVEHDPQASLAITRRVSAAVCDVVAGLSPDLALRYVVAKGGITSHEVATRGLRMRHATVLGQLFPGQVSVLRLGPETSRAGMPYVVFPGNVGERDSLARVISAMGEPKQC